MSDDIKAAEEAKAKADAEAAKKALDEASKKGEKTWPDSEVKEIIAERDKAKERARKYDEEKKKAEEAKAIEEGKLKEVLAQKEARLAEVEAKAKVYEEQEKAQREELMAKIKDEGDKKIAAELSVGNLRLFVDKLDPKAGPSGIKGARGSSDQDNPYVRRDGESYPTYQTRIDKLRSGRK